MKAQKMTILLILALSTFLILTACTPITSDEADDTAAAGDESAPPALVMATDATFPPYEFTGNEGMTGIDIEIAGKVAGKLGLQLEIKNMAFNDIIAAVQSKQADIGMAALTADETRLAAVNFSASYTTSRQVIIVNKDSDITTPVGLAGKKIGVIQGTPASVYCAEEFGESAISSYSTGTEAVQTLLQGNIDAVITDGDPADSLAQINENLVILDSEYKHDNFAVAVNKDSISLLKKINSALAELKASGEIQAIVDKYIIAE